MTPNQPTPDPSASTSKPDPEPISKSRADKLVLRRIKWRWNIRLLCISLVVLGLVLVASAISYWYHSDKTADIFLAKAESAASDGDFETQSKWLRKYSMLRPDDTNAIVDSALAANTAIATTEPAKQGVAINNARKALSLAIGRLDPEAQQEEIAQLRRLLIELQLQLGGVWFREAEQQVIRLDAPHDDAQANKWMALSLIGQVDEASYSKRTEVSSKAKGFWTALASQKPGVVLMKAVDLNPTDVDLLGFLAGVSNDHADLFDQIEGTEPERMKNLRGQVEERLAAIAGNQDSHSYLIRNFFDAIQGSSEESLNQLASVANHAEQRLKLRNDAPSPTKTEAMMGGHLPDSYWDFVLLATVARHLRNDSPEIASKYYDLLIKSKSRFVTSSMMEQVFYLAGELALSQDDPDNALQLWKQGVADENPTSVVLLGAIARLLVSKPQSETEGSTDSHATESAKAIVRFEEAIEKTSVRLAQTSDRQMPRAERAAISREVETARWRMNMLNAVLSTQDGDIHKAIGVFEKILTVQSDALPMERIDVALRLGALYESQGMWDSAADTYSFAVDLNSNDLKLRALAAAAWARAGNHFESEKHWRIVGNSQAVPMQVASLEAQFNRQLVRQPTERDFSGIRASIRRIRESLPTETDTEPIDPSTTDTPSSAVVLLRLDRLEASLPPTSNTTAEDHLKSPEFAAALGRLAETHPENADIQFDAAERLAIAGNIEQSELAYKRLGSIEGVSPTAITTSRARLLAAQGNYKEACEYLLEHTDTNASNVESVHLLAAGYASQARDISLAYQALTSIPASKRSLSTLFSITTVAARLPEDSEIIQDLKKSPAELAEQWKSELRQLEGEFPTYCQFLDAADLIAQIEANDLGAKDPLFDEARLNAQDLLSRRPRWGLAISLNGRLSAIEGKSDLAITQLKRGIAAGDRQLKTHQLLWEQLVLLNRVAEAETEINNADWSSGMTVDEYSAMRIQLAQVQGNYSRSLDMARESALQRPNDYIAHIVHAQTAILAAKKSIDAQKQTDRFVEAQAAIDKALALVDQDEIPVFSAILSLKIAQGDHDGIRDEIEHIKSSKLDKFPQLMLMSRAFVGVGDYEAAIELVKQLNDLRPSSEAYLALAELYRKLKQFNLEFTALEEAHRLTPDSASIGNQLAEAIVSRDGNDVDWDKLGELLKPTEDQTADSSRYLYAIIQSIHGNEGRQEQAMETLDELVNERNSGSDAAARALASLLQRKLPAENEQLTEPEEKQARQLDAKIRRLYDGLTRRSPTAAIDMYRYSHFLLTKGNENDRNRIETLMERLSRSRDGLIAALTVGVQLAEAKGEKDSIPKTVRDWAEKDGITDLLGKRDVASIAGAALVDLGFIEEGLKWLEDGYQQDPKLLTNYVLLLVKTDQPAKAMEVCVQHHRDHSDVDSVTLLVETMLSPRAAISITEEYRTLVKDTVEANNENPRLLEAVATLYMQDQDYDAAVKLYHQIDLLAPNRIRTLNNLAMAYSEIPGQESEGIAPVRHAIKIVGEHPELLDTLGVVLFKSGNTVEAEKTFRKATKKSNEPRFLFHLIMTMLEQNKISEAKILWKTLDLNNLNLGGLTQSERKELKRRKAEFGPGKPASIKDPITQ